MNKNIKSDYLPIPAIEGEIYVVAGKDDDEEIGEVILSGNPDGLRSLGKILIAIADLDQSSIDGLPNSETEHIHLYAGKHLGEDEEPYVFISPEELIDDFWNDVKKWRF